MPPAKKPKASKSSANAPSAPWQTMSGNSSTAKRKRADTNNTATNGSENDQTRKQPRQDNSPDHSASSTDTASTGEILFGIPQLIFQSPFEGDMRLEVATPSSKYEKGCIRFHGCPEGHWDMDAMFSLPFAFISSCRYIRFNPFSLEL